MSRYILLGLVQGLTEFLPVSSSGHLVLLYNLFGMRGLEVELAIVVHLGTALAVVIYFFKDILKLFRDKRGLLYVLAVTVITGVIGIAGKGFFEPLFKSAQPVGIALIVTGFILVVSRQYADGTRTELQWKDAGVLGFVQGLAIIPGISRSGITISSLMFRGVQREVCFRFSFLAALPAIIGAALLEFKDVSCACTITDNLGPFAVAFAASFISGMGALYLLRLVMRRSLFHFFGYYCLAIGALTLFLVP